MKKKMDKNRKERMRYTMNQQTDYFKQLEYIHNTLFSPKKEEYCVRCSKEYQEKINNILRKLYSTNYENVEELLTNLLITCSKLKLYQPFYDGNHRTILAFMYLFLKQRGYLLDMDAAWNDYLQGRNFLPVFYEDTDKMHYSYVDKFFKYISKTNKGIKK